MGYDIIGDIHGQGDKLHALLSKMGYENRQGAYRHPERKAIFVGDYIDRGPQQVQSVMTVRRMVDAGSALAVLGNHEFNAMAWFHEDPEQPGHFLRPRVGAWGLSNRAQHQAFLNEVESKPSLHSELVNWFYSLPLWLDLPDFRVVHACWHQVYIEQLRPHLTANHCLTPETLVCASRSQHPLFKATEGLTKGLEIALPAPHSFQDKDGHIRNSVRIRWWDETATRYRELAMLSEELREQVPNELVPLGQRMTYDGTKPVFFGHYWMTGRPSRLGSFAACVDYSAGKHGPLVAYRFDGEAEISDRHFVSSH
jgi:hypothetical protein